MYLKIFATLLLAGITFGAPSSKEDDDKLTISRQYYQEQFVKYQGNHEIVRITVPLNSMKFEDDSSSESESSEDVGVIVFFVESDTDENQKQTYHGLYTLQDGKVNKILENGRDIASFSDKNRTIYLAASDGVYTYREDTKTAVKYGTINDDIIGIAHILEGDVLYILTEDHKVYEVKNNGNEKVMLEDVIGAQQIVLDGLNNLYFYTSDKTVHIKTTEGNIINVEGLPEYSSKITLINPPFIIDNGVPVVLDNVVYIVYANGTSEKSKFDFESDSLPSAFAMEAVIIQYYAYDKKIYEYNLLLLVLGEILEELREFLSDKTSEIQSLSSNMHASLRSK